MRFNLLAAAAGRHISKSVVASASRLRLDGQEERGHVYAAHDAVCKRARSVLLCLRRINKRRQRSKGGCVFRSCEAIELSWLVYLIIFDRGNYGNVDGEQERFLSLSLLHTGPNVDFLIKTRHHLANTVITRLSSTCCLFMLLM